MGTWIGHIAPGFFFVIFALWWHINNCVRFFKSRVSENGGEASKQRRNKFRGSTTYPCVCLPSKFLRQLPIESIVKIIITSIHFAIELITGYNGKGPRIFIGDENAHHTAMLFGFFLGSWVEILVFYRFPLPKRITQIMGFLAFAIEGFMMVFHLHARSMMDAHIHLLLGITITFSAIEAIGECIYPNNFLLIVVRCFLALTQGTWFLQAAFVIWPTTTNPYFLWEPDSHRSVSLLTMSYAYHLAGNAFILIVVYLLIFKFMTSWMRYNINVFDDDDDKQEDLNYKLVSNNNEEESFI